MSANPATPVRASLSPEDIEAAVKRQVEVSSWFDSYSICYFQSHLETLGPADLDLPTCPGLDPWRRGHGHCAHPGTQTCTKVSYTRPVSISVSVSTPHRRSVSQSSSPAPLEHRLSAAEARRAALDVVRVKNISEQLAKMEAVRGRREEQEQERSSRTKEELEAKLEKTEEKRNAQLAVTKEKLVEHLARVERAQQELEVSTEAARLAAEFALTAKMMRAEENKDEQLEEMLGKIKEHEAYVARVRANQEERLKPYFAELEVAS